MNQAVAWDPSASRVKVEDAALLTLDSADFLIVEERWPTVAYRGGHRPDELQL